MAKMQRSVLAEEPYGLGRRVKLELCRSLRMADSVRRSLP